jgi:hypothetical protein
MVGAVMLSRLAPHQDVARAIIDSAQHAVNELLLVGSPTAR